MFDNIVEQMRNRRESVARQTHLKILRNFLASVEELNVLPESLNGNVFVAGPGRFMCERAWLCTLESDFKELHPYVDRVVVADSSCELGRELLTESSLGKVEQHFMSADNLLNSTPRGQFDAITFMRIADFANQLHMGTLESFADALKPGGYLIGSGSTRTAWGFSYSEETFDAVGQDLGLELVSFNKLPEEDMTGFLFYSNAGVIYRKAE